MPNKKPFIANKNHYFIFVGLFLVLITLILGLNIGPIARVLSTPFTYALGSVAYLVYAVFLILGLYFIDENNLQKILHEPRKKPN